MQHTTTEDEFGLPADIGIRKPSVSELNRATNAILDADAFGIEDSLARALDPRDWIPVARVALLHMQSCACGEVQSWSHGWFIRYQHARDKTCTKMDKEPHIGFLPARVERVSTPESEFCHHCAESSAIIGNVTL